MSSFFNMFIEFTTRNLNEYKKIIDTLIGCQTLTQYEIIKNMSIQFAKNCDYRLNILKKSAIKSILYCSFRKLKEYFRYKHSTDIQMESIITHCNKWIKTYEEWLIEQKQQDELDIQKLKEKKSINGFTKLYSKRKKKGNQ